jgi:hypothetical protein
MSDRMEKQFFNPSKIHRPRRYTHAAAVDSGRIIFHSESVQALAVEELLIEIEAIAVVSG